MAETVELPAIGRVDRRWLWAGGAAVAAILVYAYWRNAQTGDDELVIDPSTGAAGEGGAAPAPNAGGSVDASPGGSGTPTTNTEWTQAAITALVEVGYEPGHVATVLGKYLGKQPLTADEQDLVRTVWAIMGKPPEGSFPLNPTPEPDPTPDPTPKPPPAPPGLRVASTAKNVVVLEWNPAAGATRYELQRTSPTVGSMVATDGTEFTFWGLKPNTSYRFQVRSQNAQGRSAWRSVSAKTKR